MPTLRFDTRHDPDFRLTRRAPAEKYRPLRVLSVVESTNQMYSGIGRNLRELALRRGERIRLEFAIDDHVPSNRDLLVEFADQAGIPVHVGRAGPDCVPDPVNLDLPALLTSKPWDVVEIVGWANANNHGHLLDLLGEDTVLAYTPHHQPTSTIPNLPPEHARRLETVQRRVLARADLVFCDSPWERRELQPFAAEADRCVHLNLGSDFEAFAPGPLDRKPQLLVVSDWREPRKRFDVAVGVFGHLHRRWRDLRLAIIGNRSEEALERVPRTLRPFCDPLGYVSEDALRRTYAESLALLAFSDYEAFGLPILEALACGTPVFLTRQAATFSLFGRRPGAFVCPSPRLNDTFEIVETILADRRRAVGQALAGRDALRESFDWSGIARRKEEFLTSAAYRRRGWIWAEA